jgi:hypothetical protein
MSSWDADNLKFLSSCVDRVRLRLEELSATKNEYETREWGAWPEWNHDGRVPNIVGLVESVGLTTFSLELLLLCVGMELDSRMAHLCGKIQESDELKFPTFSLALRLFHDAHWDALASGSPLRKYRLVNVCDSDLMTQGRLSVDERVWQHLLGIDHIDTNLRRITEDVSVESELVPSHSEFVDQIVAGLHATSATTLPVIQLTGRSSADQLAIAAHVCSRMGLPLYRLPVFHLPEPGEQLEIWTHLMEREVVLNGAVFLLDGHVDKVEHEPHQRSVARLLSQVPGLLFFTNRNRTSTGGRKTLVHDVKSSSESEQLTVWQESLACWPDEVRPIEDGWIATTSKALVGNFVMDSITLRSAAEQALGIVSATQERPVPGDVGFRAVWDACRAQVRPMIDSLAERLLAPAEWSDLVLPEAQLSLLKEIEAQVRHRQVVYSEWFLGGRTSRGRGTAVMFSGPSGTGKTLAAEALTTRLNLDLYRVDLGSTVSKYIGETEKNLGKIFDAAESGGVALLFDEADALFGKRGDVKDSKDRYANIEVSFLLQRLESFQGLVILTTNLRDSLDQAFQRRLRFVVEFPFPNAKQRQGIWKTNLQVGAPTEDIDYTKLARLNISGGTIRNIVVNAAFRAASGDGVIRMGNLKDAVRMEFSKAQHVLTAQDVGDWV